MSRIATCVWSVDGRLLLALDERLGPPVDSYVNGTQSWLTDDGPGDATLEWRLHPVAGYRIPRGMSHYDLWEQAIAAYSRDPDVDAIDLGTERRALDTLWDGLECFAAYDDDLEPAVLAARGVGRAATRAGPHRARRPRPHRHRVGAQRRVGVDRGHARRGTARRRRPAVTK